MRTLPLLLLFAAPLQSAEPSVAPSVVLGTSALLAKEHALGVAFSPDSERILLIETEGTRSWHLALAKPGPGQAISGLLTAGRLSFASDGRSFCSATNKLEKYRLLRWDADGGEPRNHEVGSRPQSEHFSECGQYAALQMDRGVRILSMIDGEELIDFPGIESLRRFTAAADGRAFAFCNQDGHVFIRSINGPSWSPLLAVKQRFATVAISPDGKLVATASFVEDDGGRKMAAPIVIHSMEDRSVAATCEACTWFAEFPNRLRFTPDGKTLLAGDGAYLRGWDAATGKKIFAVEPGWNYPGSLVISPNSRYIAVAYTRRAMVWDLQTGLAPPGFEGHTGPVWELEFSGDGTRVATTSYGLPQVAIWNAKSGKLHSILAPQYAETSETTLVRREPASEGKPVLGTYEARTTVPGRVRVVFSYDGRQAVTVNEATGSTGPVRLWNVDTARPVWELPIQDRFAPHVALTHHGVLVTHLQAKSYKFDTGSKDWFSPMVFTNAMGVKVNRRGDRTVIEDKDSSHILDAATGRTIATVGGIPHCFTPDGRSLVVIRIGPNMTGGTFNDSITRVNLDGGKDVELGKVPMGQAVGRLSPDGELRVVHLSLEGGIDWTRAYEFREVAGDRLISVAHRVESRRADDPWDAAFLREHRPLAVAFSTDSRLFAAVYPDGRLGVWDVATGESFLSVETGCTSPKFVAFSPDSRMVFTSSGDGAGGPVYGFDTTGRGGAADLRGRPAQARRAIYSLATDKAVAEAAAILLPTTNAQIRGCEQWIGQLESPVFAEREAAMKGLGTIGWRVEPLLRKALATTTSEEARERLATLLAVRDVRPLRAVHLLELAGGDAAKQDLAKLAKSSPESYLTREARRALERMTAP